jgi:hypothetical protein
MYLLHKIDTVRRRSCLQGRFLVGDNETRDMFNQGGCLGLLQIRALAWPAVLVGLVSQSARYTPITVCLQPELLCGCILGSIGVFLI